MKKLCIAILIAIIVLVTYNLRLAHAQVSTPIPLNSVVCNPPGYNAATRTCNDPSCDYDNVFAFACVKKIPTPTFPSFTPTPNIPAPSAPCAPGGWDGSKCTKVTTALGEISTTPPGFVKSVFGYLLSISGGVALIFIILSGYQLIFSHGDPEKVKEARDRLTSAIIGLLFVVFSMVILQVIGVDLLHLPGFKP